MRSMTGFGRGSSAGENFSISVELKAVNNRFLDVSLRMPAELQAIEPRITAAVFDVLTPQASAASRMSYGGTSPEQVRAQIARWQEKL